MKILIIAALLAATPVFTSSAWAETPKPANAPVVSPDGSLYRAFGGHDGLERVVGDMYANINADDRIKDFFEPAKEPHTKAMLVEQLCQITGGGCTYSGKDMEKVHREMGITRADFDALVEDLQKAMTKNHIPIAAQNQLLAALAPQNRVIVYKPRPEDSMSQGPVSK